jgi:hypothetical protein
MRAGSISPSASLTLGAFQVMTTTGGTNLRDDIIRLYDTGMVVASIPPHPFLLPLGGCQGTG